MNKFTSIASLAALAITAPLAAQDTEKPEYPSPNAIVEQASPEEWVAIAPSDLLVMDLAPDAEGNARRVIIQLMPEPFSQGWIRNIRKLAEAHWWDGTSINRVQDNYVVQWGDAGYDNPESGETEQKALPEGLETVPEEDYVSADPTRIVPVLSAILANIENKRLMCSDSVSYVECWATKVDDPYSSGTSLYQGWPIAYGQPGISEAFPSPLDLEGYWPVHCYGMVGVGRGLTPDTGSGTELYTVIGHAPRHLDRNIAVVGRIIEGIEHLSSLPRGKGQLGFYEDASKRVPITSIRLGNELAEDPSPAFEYLDTESETFAKYADARANRRDPFFNVPAGGADICNIPVPVRRVKGE